MISKKASFAIASAAALLAGLSLPAAAKDKVKVAFIGPLTGGTAANGIGGRNSAELTNLIGSGNPNMDAMKYIQPELTKLPAVFPPKDVQAKLEQLKDLTVAQRRLRNKLWTEIKASR